MKNFKFIAGFSIFGFLLSILSSFHTVARSGGTRFFIAVAFALAFGILAAVIQFVAQKFVFAENGSDFSENSARNTQNSSGNQPVDIVIQDEELPAEENGSQFFVGTNHQMLNKEDLQDVKSVSETENTSVSSLDSEPHSEPQNNGAQSGNSADVAQQIKNENSSSGNSGFVPLNFAENPSNISSVESKSMSEIKSDEKKSLDESLPVFTTPGNSGNDSETLDVLPDLESFSEAQASDSSENSGFAENTSFSENKDTNYASGGGYSKEKSSAQDAEVMAKAISTLLSKDK